MKPTVLVTGDIVLDCHLYGGVRTVATSLSEPGTFYDEFPGGASLTHRLLRAAADVDGAEYDATLTKWQSENKTRKKAGKKALPRPDDLPHDRPAPIFEAELALDTRDLGKRLPRQLRSYGVWTDRPVSRGSKDRVWRVDKHFGYGKTEPAASDDVLKLNRGAATSPVLTLIDDGGLLFRHVKSRAMWPDFAADVTGHYLLKMSWPLCRGDLWPALDPVMDRLIVVVSADDLRREDVQISHRLSWEQCAENTFDAFQNDPAAHELLRVAHVIVNFGSEGALWVHRQKDLQLSARLLFDPVRLEGDHAREFEGTAYGFQTCLAVGIAFHLMRNHAEANGGNRLSPFRSADAMEDAIHAGTAAGLTARRQLLELGHGNVRSTKPGFPVDALGPTLAGRPGGFVSVAVPADCCQRTPGRQWTILAQAELADGQDALPLTGLAQLTARYGQTALSHVPALKLGGLFTVDRSEIERLRTVDALMRTYEATKVQKRPLSIGVFGPPGSGKSFGVKALAKATLGDKVPFLEFNLSQFKNPEELIGAFHRVRDAVLQGTTPVAFWDEFDSQRYKWLQYLLAPMQDGSFQEGQITHPIGKCVFMFAGGTSATLGTFGVAEPTPPTPQDLAALSPRGRMERNQTFREQVDRYGEFKLLKGPDFVSRLHGFVNVLEPNPPRTGATGSDITWPIRRALLLRNLLELDETEELNIDPGLLYALLSVPRYDYGARSFEKIVLALARGREDGRIHRAALPPESALNRETDAVEFRKRMEQHNAFKNQPDIEKLAAAVHHRFLSEAEKSRLVPEPHAAWTIDPAIKKAYDDLDDDAKASNRAAARRIPDHLALIDFVVVPRVPDEDDSWMKPLTAAIEKHIERLAQAEHLGWCAERAASGWTYAETRDNNLKRHPLLTDWAKLSPADQDKDRSSARSIPDLLEVAGFKAVPV